MDSGGPLCVPGLPAYVAVRSGVCKGLGVTEAGAVGRWGSVEEVGLRGVGEGQWGGGNCSLGRVKIAGWSGHKQ